jgi:Protein of unknown function (DUF2705)
LVSHVHRIMNNKLSRLIFIIILLLPCVDFVQLLVMKYQSHLELHPAFSFFLAGSTRGHASQILLLWFLPIYFLLLTSEDAIQDSETGYRNILISKMGRKKYCLEKLATSFSVSFITMFISLFLNFILVYIFFRNDTYMRGLNKIELPNNELFTLSIAHPYLAVIGFSLVACVMAGLAGVIGSAFSLFFLDRKYTYIAAFFIWFVLILKKNSTMFLFQPFAEYGFDTLIPVLLLAMALFILIPFVIFIYEVKYNES